jgi:hypothetical protein
MEQLYNTYGNQDPDVRFWILRGGGGGGGYTNLRIQFGTDKKFKFQTLSVNYA